MLGTRGISGARFAALALVVTSVLAGTVTAPGTAGGQDAGGSGPPPPAAAEAPGGESGGPPPVVTLVTGDRVTLLTIDGEPVPRVEPGEGREGIRFATQRVGDHVYVVPSDAVALLNADRLDRRLFDVAALAGFGYDDASRGDLPLIVESEGRAAPVPEADVATAGAEARALPAAGATAVRQPKDRAAEFWAEVTATGGGGPSALALERPIGKVWLDGLRQAHLDRSVPQVGAPSAWEAGYTGAGVTVAVLDTGIDPTHADMAGRIAEARDFTDEGDPEDRFGHGTHVASILGGSGARSGGRYRGVAPDATLLNGKVCDSFGSCPESAILAGMEWAVASGARVVNLSLGGPDTPEVDPLEGAIDALSAEHGTLFVVAAGNDGPRDGTVGSPASADAALAVGAVDDADALAWFSSRGPRVGDAALKPEVTAPGVDIAAARARFDVIGEPVEDGYASLSGTSMATPHVAGAAALLAQQHPDWAGDRLKALLVGSADDAEGVGAYAQGAGRIDVGRAVSQSVHAEPAVVSAGRPEWPHEDDEPIDRTVTYRNPGPEPVTLDLAVDGLGPDGEEAPDGMFALDAERVTVPAGGEAAVGLTVDTSVPAAEGFFSAAVVATATAGGAVVSTPVAVDREPESYDLTVVHRDGDGTTTPDYFAALASIDEELWDFPYDPDGAYTVRLPRGRYVLDALILGGDEIASLVQPLVELEGDTTVELDARAGRPLDVRVERPGATVAIAQVGYDRATAWGQWGSGLLTFSLDGLTTAHVGPDVPDDEMASMVQGIWALPDAGGEPTTDRVYDLAWFDEGRMLTGLRRRVRDDQLARVRTQLRAAGDDRTGAYFSIPQIPGRGAVGGSAVGFGAPLPGERVSLVNTRDVEWAGAFIQEEGPDQFPEHFLDSDPVAYRPGRTYREAWNAAVLGPIVSDGSDWICSEGREETSERAGDTIAVSVELLADAAGHTGCGILTDARTSLSRDGEPVGETSYDGYGQFDVPAEAGAYRLEASVTRPETAALSTRATAAWTFRSEHVDGDEPEPLPLLAVRFAPRLDDYNRAPAGGLLRVPVTIDRLGDVGRVGAPTVEVSTDDGATWAPTRVYRSEGGAFVAAVQHPDRGGFVSLRARAADDRGNAVEQTTIRAYELAAGSTGSAG